MNPISNIFVSLQGYPTFKQLDLNSFCKQHNAQLPTTTTAATTTTEAGLQPSGRSGQRSAGQDIRTRE